MNPGFASLRTPQDLLAKLHHDRARIEAAPSDPYPAFDFFVSAEHLTDWVAPGLAKKEARKQLRGSAIALAITSHIANGSKHFVSELTHHRSVSDVEATPDWVEAGWVQSGWIETGELIITLEGAAANELGTSIGIRELADKLLAWWDAYFATR
jgi:hypothetical protein